jgi:hypothetical protein
MRFRFLKPTNHQNERFAWLPKRLSNGTIVWLEPYRRVPRGYGYQTRSNG